MAYHFDCFCTSGGYVSFGPELTIQNPQWISFNNGDCSIDADLGSVKLEGADGNIRGVAYAASGYFANDQYSQSTFYGYAGLDFSKYAGQLVRVSGVSGGTFNGYGSEFHADGTFSIVRFDNTVRTILSSISHSLTDGQFVRIEAQGTTLTAKVDGVTVLSCTDSTYSSGYTGLFISSQGYLQLFEGGDLGGSPPPSTRRYFIIH